jgi:hypothetical protein
MIVREPLGLAKYNYTNENPSFSGKLKLGIVKDGIVVCVVRAYAWSCGAKHLLNLTFTCSSLKGLTTTIDMRTGKEHRIFDNTTKASNLTFCFLNPWNCK